MGGWGLRGRSGWVRCPGLVGSRGRDGWGQGVVGVEGGWVVGSRGGGVKE